MRRAIGKAGPALALAALAAILASCGGGGSTPGAATRPDGGGSPLTLPADFPQYRGLEIVKGFVLGDWYIVEATSQDPPEDVQAFYAQELARGRWRLRDTRTSDQQGTIFFTAPGSSTDGRVVVTEGTAGSAGQTIVAIAMPVDSVESEQ